MQRKLRATLRHNASMLTEHDRKLGAEWYPQAAYFARMLALYARISEDRAAAVISALSPRVTWRANIRFAEAAVKQEPKPTGCLGRSWDNAQRILRGENPEDVLKGPKTFAFWRNIIGDPNRVTVDIWALRACGFQKDKLTPREYAEIERAFVAVAREQRMPPREFQAALWVVMRGRHD